MKELKITTTSRDERSTLFRKPIELKMKVGNDLTEEVRRLGPGAEQIIYEKYIDAITIAFQG